MGGAPRKDVCNRMSIYFKIPIEDEAGYTPEIFAARYLELTTVRGNPEIYILGNMREEKEDGVKEYQMCGSSRLHIDDAKTLVAEFPITKYYILYPSKTEWDRRKAIK